LKAGVELDRSRRLRSETVDAAVEGLLESFERVVQLPINETLTSDFQAIYDIYRHAIAPDSGSNLRVVTDLVEAVGSFCESWRAQLLDNDESEIHEMMRTALDIHQFCLSRAMASDDAMLGFAA
jgi:hypothetical protein